MKLNKKIINKAFIGAIALASVAALGSCDDMLDTKPQGTFSEAEIGADNYEELLTSAYATLMNHFLGNNEAFAAPINNWVMDVRSDDALKGGGDMNYEEYMHQLEVGNVRSDMQTVNYKWRDCFYAIARCNTVIKAIEGNDNIPNVASVIAEMKTLRAFWWFELWRCYERFPFFTEKDNPSEVAITSDSKNQAMAALKQDLKDAYAILPENQDVPGRFNKYVAAALLAKASLYTKDWANAEFYANEVIKSRKYSLYPNFLDMSDPTFNNQYEAVLAVQFSSANTPNQFNYNNCLNCPKIPGADGAGVYGNGDGFYLASQNLVNAFRTDANGLPLFDTFNDEDVLTADYAGNVDPRLDFTMGRSGMPWRGIPYTDECQIGNQFALYGNHSGKKPYTAPDSPYCTTGIVPWGANTLNMLLIRYADVMLMKAEALVEQNKNLDVACALVNEIRNRAKASWMDSSKAAADCNPMVANYSVEPYASFPNQEYARKAVRMERRLELAMEGHRWFDLVRWGIVVETVNKYYASEVKHHSYYQGAYLPASNIYFPVPKDQIDNAGGLYN